MARGQCGRMMLSCCIAPESGIYSSKLGLTEVIIDYTITIA